MSNDLIRVEELAIKVGVSIKTIQTWYMFKKYEPDNEYAKMLPDFIQEGERQTRYWKKSDVKKIVNFKNSLPHGRAGILGSITQKYYKRKVN